jgi:hypothetical protein
MSSKKQKRISPHLIVIAVTLLISGTIFALTQIQSPLKSLSQVESASTSGLPEGDPITKKVFVLIFDPIMPDGQKLTVSRNWMNPVTASNDAVNFFKNVTNNKVTYSIQETHELQMIPKKIDGFTYTPQSYEAVLANPPTAHNPDSADYYEFLNDPTLDICGKLNRNEIDELWMFGGPWFGFSESALATSPTGPNGFAYNGPTYTQTACNRLIPIMGFNYERQLAEMVHDWGHRTEASMSEVYGSWEENRTLHNWDKFGLVKAQSPSFPFSGCGSAHWPPNAVSDYDYGNPSSTSSFCDDFNNYPNLSSLGNNVTNVNCTLWECSQLGYFEWWFRHIPHFAGTAPDGKLNDWWQYIIDPNKAVVQEIDGEFTNLEGNFNANLASYSLNYSGSTRNYIIDMSTLPDMSSDVYLTFAQNRFLPISVVNPQSKWGKYTCGNTLYWRVYNANKSISSAIQATTIDCSATPAPTVAPTPTQVPTLAPTAIPTPKPTLTPSPTPKTFTFSATEDSFTKQKSSSSNFGTSQQLFVDKIDTASGEMRTFLKFTVSGVSKFNSARVRLFLTDGSNNAPKLYSTSSSWQESTIKWSNQPSLGSSLTNLGQVNSNTWVEYDVTSAVKKNSNFSFSLAGENNVDDGIIISSRESTNKPQLIIVGR